MKVILTFKKARFDADALGFYTVADASFYNIVKEYVKVEGINHIIIKRLADYDSIQKCKIVFDGPAAQQAVYAFIELFGERICKIKMRVKK